MKKILLMLLGLLCPILAHADYTVPGGVVLAADPVSGVNYPKFKLCDGTAGGTSCAAITNGTLPITFVSTQFTLPGIAAQSSGTITSVGSTVQVIISSYSNVSIAIAPGNSTGVSVVFELSYDAALSTWTPVQVDISSSFAAVTSYTLNTSTQTFQVAVAGFTGFRVRATAWASGTAVVYLTPSGASTVPLVTVGQTVPSNLQMQAFGGASTNTVPANLNPVLEGGIAYNAVPATNTVNASAVNSYYAPDGARVENLDCPRQMMVKSSATIAASTAETVILSSGAAGVYNDLISMVLANTSATATRVDFRSGGNGTTIDFAVYVPAGDTRPVPLSGHRWPQTLTQANWTAQSSASITDIRIYGLYCQSK